jgi:hypothetical protein
MSHQEPFLKFSGDNLFVGHYTVKPLDGFKLPEDEETGKRFPECCEAHIDLQHRIQDWYEKLPNCCERHRKLFETRGWDKHKAYPDLVHKILIQSTQTEHFIESKIDSVKWQQEIIDYIDHNNDSFGHPNLGAERYMNHVIHFISDSSCINSKDKKAALLNEINDRYYSTLEVSSQTDLNVLHSAYQKWISAFPFDLSVFQPLKEKFEKQLPIIKEVHHKNKYSGKTTVTFHTKESLVDALISVTNKLLTEINSYSLSKSGQLNEPDILKLEMIMEERKVQLAEGYASEATDEQTRYRRMVKQWLRDEIRFIGLITPIAQAVTKAEQAVANIKSLSMYDQIRKRFELIDKNKGWKYTFRNENDLECICNLIASYFEDQPYELPQELIRLRKRTKTRTAIVLGEIHRDLSENQFSTDEDFLTIVRCIKDFENLPDLAKALKR